MGGFPSPPLKGGDGFTCPADEDRRHLAKTENHPAFTEAEKLIRVFAGANDECGLGVNLGFRVANLHRYEFNSPDEASFV